MATTPNYGLTLLEVGQKEKEVTINTNFTALDAAPKFLGSFGSHPSTANVALGSFYYSTNDGTCLFLVAKNPDFWSP